jgi:hypothetical protein
MKDIADDEVPSSAHSADLTDSAHEQPKLQVMRSSAPLPSNHTTSASFYSFFLLMTWKIVSCQ